MDILSDILSSVHLGGGVHFRCEFAAPWGIEMPETSVVPFHVVIHGNFWLRLPGRDEPVALRGGDLVVLPDGGAHTLLDSPGSPIRPLGDVISAQPLENFGPLRNDGNGQPASILCGYFHYRRENAHPMLAALPPLIHIRNADSQDLAWLQTALNFMIRETRAARPGAHAVVNRLVGVLFIQILRTYIEQARPSGGILGALADKPIAGALARMHGRPQQAWTLETLAHEVGMSRSAFAARFHELVQQTPMQYLGDWRMQLARRMLADTHLPTAVVAERVGYGSEASFGKAFKKAHGMGPGAYRRAAQAQASELPVEEIA